MRQLPFFTRKSFIPLLSLLLTVSVAHAQGNKIDWANDTISKTDAIAAKLNYLNNIRGGGNANATEQINLPVDKLKEILDACAANNITNVSVVFIKLRSNDVAHFKRLNPAAVDNDLKGSQMLVFKVPRNAFAGAKGAKINVGQTSPLMLSLMAAGLVLVDSGNIEAPATPPGGAGNYYFSFGSICPPPASCDTDLN